MYIYIYIIYLLHIIYIIYFIKFATVITKTHVMISYFGQVNLCNDYNSIFLTFDLFSSVVLSGVAQPQPHSRTFPISIAHCFEPPARFAGLNW